MLLPTSSKSLSSLLHACLFYRLFDFLLEARNLQPLNLLQCPARYALEVAIHTDSRLDDSLDLGLTLCP